MRKKKDNFNNVEISTVGRIKIIHGLMKDIVLDAGIQEPQYNYAIKNIEKQSEEYQVNFLAWLVDFRDKEYNSIKMLLNQFSGWEHYKVMGINNFPEQVILRRRQKALREAWHNRLRPERKKHENM